MFGAFNIIEKKIVFASVNKEDRQSFLKEQANSNLKEIKQGKSCFWFFEDTGEQISPEFASSSFSDLKPVLHSAYSRSLID